MTSTSKYPVRRTSDHNHKRRLGSLVTNTESPFSIPITATRQGNSDARTWSRQGHDKVTYQSCPTSGLEAVDADGILGRGWRQGGTGQDREDGQEVTTGG
jgi:hypothetical protein